MTTLIKDQPYYCTHTVNNGIIITVCDQQCDNCKELQKKL